MPCILIAECKQEISTFNPRLRGYDDFDIRRGQELLDCHRTVRNEIGGALDVFDAIPDDELIPTYRAFFVASGGTLAKAAWEQISRELLEAVNQLRRIRRQQRDPAPAHRNRLHRTRAASRRR